MWEQVVLWEHTHACLVGACIVYFHVALEGVEVALMLNELEWYYHVDGAVARVLVVLEAYEFETYCILESLLVDDISNLVTLTCLDAVGDSVGIGFYYCMLSQRSATFSFHCAISFAN